MSDNMERVLGILSKLVAFPSVSSTSNKSIIDFIDNYLKQHGVITHRTVILGVTEDPRQGNRASEALDEGFEELIAPACLFELSAV